MRATTHRRNLLAIDSSPPSSLSAVMQLTVGSTAAHAALVH